ncbi:unnamed protein product [Heterobilharzia americana]|nr:unnamed protein product [Heterobilharzia americana]
MITVASLTPMIAHFYYKFRNPNQQQCLLWLSYLGFGLLGLSRCYLAAHFPHQVVTGIISGLMIGLLFHSVSESITSSSEENTNWLHRQIAHFLSHPNELLWLGFSSFICAYLFSLFLEYGMKLDPNWSINLAQSACARSEWIHLSTSPMMGFSRIAGTTTGLSLGLRFRPMDSQQSVLGTNSAQIIFFSLVIVLLTTKFMESLCNSIINLFTTYILDDFTGYINVIQLLNAFLQAIICPLTTICIVPIFMRLFHHKHDN